MARRRARAYADPIDPSDVPPCWLELGTALTADVEAKARERAIVALRRALGEVAAA